jgi:hypothetical protein
MWGKKIYNNLNFEQSVIIVLNFKGIVSQKFCVLFMVSFYRY